MTGETPDSLIPYDEIVQEALRAVVGRAGGRLPAYPPGSATGIAATWPWSALSVSWL